MENYSIENLSFRLLNSSSAISVSKDNEYCETYGEWLSLGYKTFLRKTSAYYFKDLNKIYINYLRNTNDGPSNFSLSLNVQCEEKSKTNSFKKKIHNYQVFYGEKWATSYAQETISIHFNLEEELFENIDYQFDLESIRMNLQVFDLNLGVQLRKPLDLKVAYSPHHKEKKESLPIKSSRRLAVCTKVLFIDNDKQFENFKMWVHINKVIGFEKLVVYNRPGYLFDEKRQEYFNRHKSLIEVRHQICMPNLNNPINESHKYYHDFKDANQITSKIYDGLDTTSYIFLGECYLDLFSQFE